jgi:hypothetical protein
MATAMAMGSSRFDGNGKGDGLESMATAQLDLMATAMMVTAMAYALFLGLVKATKLDLMAMGPEKALG